MDFMQITEQEDLAHKHFSDCWLYASKKKRKEKKNQKKKNHVVMLALQPWMDTNIPQSK